jgi:hypothetical protein
MITQRNIRGFKATYHRNGICGEPFHLCRFQFAETPRAPLVEMQAIVFDAPGHVAVTSALSTDRWRGDDFEPALREAIELVRAAQPEALHKC